MAKRCLLSQKKIKKFAEWLEINGYKILPVIGKFEVLRAKSITQKDTVIIYRQLDKVEHYTVQNKDYRLVREFINSQHEQVSVAD